MTPHHLDQNHATHRLADGVNKITTGLDANAERRYRRIAALIGLVVCGIGAGIVSLWIRYRAGPIGINTSVGFCVAGLTLALQCLQARCAVILRILSGLLAALVTLLGVAVLTYQLLLQPAWLEHLLLLLPVALNDTRGAPPHLLCAVSFMLIGLALLLQECRLQRGTQPAEYLALALIALNLVPLAGHAYGVTALTSLAPAEPMPWTAALAFLALGCGVLLSRPGRRLMSILTENVPGGQMLRKSLPQTLLVLVILNWLVNRGAQNGYYATDMAAPILTLLNSAVILVIFWRTAFTVNNEYRSRLHSASDLAEATSLLIAVSDHTEDAIFVKDREGRLIFANPAMLRRLGKTREEAMYCTNRALLIDPQEADRVTQDDQRIMLTGRSEVIEQTLHYPDGQHTYITTKTPWFDSQGTLRGITAISTNISLRKAMEQQLKEREAELESTVLQRTATLRKLADHLESVREEEKRAIARELHDNILTSRPRHRGSTVRAPCAASPRSVPISACARRWNSN